MAAKNTFLYFAFGSNLLTKRIHIKNPSAKFKDVASLDDYKLEFRLPSKRWRGCAATISKCAGDKVLGCLWELDMQHLATLDDQEGVHNGLYERIKVKVDGLKTSDSIEVYTYQVCEDKLRAQCEDCRPSKVYKTVIVDGAVEHDFPQFYVDRLKAIVDNGYGGEVEIGLPLNVQD